MDPFNVFSKLFPNAVTFTKLRFIVGAVASISMMLALALRTTPIDGVAQAIHSCTDWGAGTLANLARFVAQHGDGVVIAAWGLLSIALAGFLLAIRADIKTETADATSDSRATYTFLPALALLWQAHGPGRALFVALIAVIPIILILLITAKVATPAIGRLASTAPLVRAKNALPEGFRLNCELQTVKFLRWIARQPRNPFARASFLFFKPAVAVWALIVAPLMLTLRVLAGWRDLAPDKHEDVHSPTGDTPTDIQIVAEAAPPLWVRMEQILDNEIRSHRTRIEQYKLRRKSDEATDPAEVA
ncbi:hypothetical protein FHY52_04460 [Nocardia nova]|jgi:hypothetical protein|uniref:hypothetical protein n=1 Tax=Nocardia nova TaxID=37330 RepID=UPI0025AF8428|nr:hypothetical protein [Nocardia nova]MDN2495951.1 hypothetical protein [Nocardia nova]